LHPAAYFLIALINHEPPPPTNVLGCRLLSRQDSKQRRYINGRRRHKVALGLLAIFGNPKGPQVGKSPALFKRWIKRAFILEVAYRNNMIKFPDRAIVRPGHAFLKVLLHMNLKSIPGVAYPIGPYILPALRLLSALLVGPNSAIKMRPHSTIQAAPGRFADFGHILKASLAMGLYIMWVILQCGVPGPFLGFPRLAGRRTIFCIPMPTKQDSSTSRAGSVFWFFGHIRQPCLANG